MATPLLCGIDAGTGSIRALLFDPQGGRVAQGSVPTPTIDEGRGMASHAGEALFDGALEALQAAIRGLPDGRSAKEIRTISVASMGEAGMLLDDGDRPLTPVIAWYDTRTRRVFDRIIAEYGTRYFHEITGLCPDPTFTLLKWLWMREQLPEAWERAAHWLNVGDYLAFRFSGERATDLSIASRTMMLDLGERRWSNDILERFSLQNAWLPPIRPSGSVLGTVRTELQEALGLDAGCRIAVGGHDHICGMVAVGADRPGHLLDSMGTAEGLTMTMARPALGQAVANAGLNQGAIQVVGCDPVYYGFGGLPTSAGAIEWFHKALAENWDREALIEAASGKPPGSEGVMFFPQLRIGSPPHPDPVARGAFLGLASHDDKPLLYRAVLEGVALDADQIIGCMIDLFELEEPKRVTAIGGSSRNGLLMGIKAALFGRPIDVSATHDATAMGAALVAGLGAGLYDDVSAAFEAMAPATYAAMPIAGYDEQQMQRMRAVYAEGKRTLRTLHSQLLEH